MIFLGSKIIKGAPKNYYLIILSSFSNFYIDSNWDRTNLLF